MISQDERQSLIEYRLNQARNTIDEVGTLIEANLLNVAVNRIYYGMFYCLNALALKYEFESSKHSQLMGWFNREFIKTGLIDIHYGKILRDAFKNRNEGEDYMPFVEFELNEVLERKTEMKEFVKALTLFIQNPVR